MRIKPQSYSSTTNVACGPMSSKRNMRLILGSASRTRQAILKEMGYRFEVQTADIDEKAIRKSDAQELVMALAHAKASPRTALLKKISRTEMVRGACGKVSAGGRKSGSFASVQCAMVLQRLDTEV